MYPAGVMKYSRPDCRVAYERASCPCWRRNGESRSHFSVRPRDFASCPSMTLSVIGEKWFIAAGANSRGQGLQRPIRSQLEHFVFVAVQVADVPIPGNDMQLLFAGQSVVQKLRCLRGIDFIVFAPQDQGWHLNLRDTFQRVDEERLSAPRKRKRGHGRASHWIGLELAVHFRVGRQTNGSELAQRNAQLPPGYPFRQPARQYQK